MDSLKKIAKKTFSVLCAKRNVYGPCDSTLADKVYPQTEKKAGSMRQKVKSNIKDKKAGKNADNPKSESARTKQSIKDASKKTSVSRKETRRNLTDAEYEAIFKAVIEMEAVTLEEEDVYMAPTQLDSQTEKKPTVDKLCKTGTPSAVQKKHSSTREKDCDPESSDKENLTGNESAAGDAADGDQFISKSRIDSKQIAKKKVLHDTSNSKTKRGGDITTTVPKGNKLKEKEIGEDDTKCRKRKKDASKHTLDKKDADDTGKHKKCKKDASEHTQDKKKESVEIDVGGKAHQGEVGGNKRREKTRKSKKDEKELVQDDVALAARVNDGVVKEQIALDLTEEKSEAMAACESNEAISKSKLKESKKDEIAASTDEENNEPETRQQQKDGTASKETENNRACKNSEETDTSCETNNVSEPEESKETDTGSEKLRNLGTDSEKRETNKKESKEKRKDEKFKRKDEKLKGRNKNKLSKEGKKGETQAKQDGTEQKEPSKKDEKDFESSVKDENEIKSKKTDTNTGSAKRKKIEGESKNKKKREGGAKKNEKDNMSRDNFPSKDGEKAESSGKERGDETTSTKERKDELTSKEEERDDQESVLSEQSLGSSLLDMALAVDQWDRPEEMQENNELTPCSSEAEAVGKKKSPTVGKKPKKTKSRKNELAPRKLSFDGTASSKKQRTVEEADSDDASSLPAEIGTWVQCDVKGCQKWRYLPDIHDPVELPQHWVCSMNTDERYNSCEKAEQVYDESDHIFTQYTLGSIVWAKMDGFPWWPAMVDTDPDSDIYCQIPHEDSMIPTDYHLVFLDEKVTRTWIRKSRIQHLTFEHLSPGSIFMKGHKYKKEIQIAMRRAETALYMTLQDRLVHFGFAACFRNLTTKWTKAAKKTKQSQKRIAPKQVQKSGSSSGAISSKKSRLATDRQLYKDDSDSDSCSPNTGYSPDSDLSSLSSSSDDEDETTRKKVLVRQKRKAKLDEGRKVLKETPSVSGGIVKRRKTNGKDQNRVKPKNRNVRPSPHSGDRPHQISSSVTAKACRYNRKEYSTDSESDVTVSSDEGEKKFTKTTKQQQKKKFSAAKKGESKSSVKENGDKRGPLSVLNSEDKTFTEADKGDNKKAYKIPLHRNKTATSKVNADKISQTNDSRKKKQKFKESSKVPKYESKGELHKQIHSDHSAKEKKLFKSEMAKKRDELLRLQQEEKRTKAGSAEDKKMRTKPQKFIAPVKMMAEKSASSKLPLPPSKKSNKNSETLDDPESDQKHLNEIKGDNTEFKLTASEEKQLPVPKEIVKQSPFSSQPGIHSPVTKQYIEKILTPHKSSPLGPQYRDQFVPSMEESDNTDDDKISVEETTSADKKWKSKGLSQMTEVAQEGKRSEESDSDCLDLEEDLLIPSLQQVLQVQSKGSSDLEAVLSDPLEMVED